MDGDNLPELVKQITIHYAQFYYDKFVKKYENKEIPDSDIREFVNSMYESKKDDLKKYIRSSLKDNLKERYSSIAVENLLLEMFSDVEYGKERIYQEIKNRKK